MARWIDIPRDRTLDRPRWARGTRRPLRRNEGVPVPLETPVYLHRQELERGRARRRRLLVPLLWFLAAAAVTALVGRLLFVAR